MPYDAPRPNDPARNTSARFIRDDELGRFLDALRDTLGPSGHVLLLVDACHSATMTRGQARVRTDNFRPGPVLTHSDWLDATPSGWRSAGGRAKLVLMAGSQAGEASFETLDEQHQPVGSLSYAFSRAVSTLRPGDTYRALFANMQVELRRKTPDQTPSLEGDASERVWGEFLTPASAWGYVRQVGARSLRLAQGLLAGYAPGAKVRVRRGDGPTLSGTVSQSGPFEALVTLPDSLPPGPDSLGWRVERTEQALPPWPLRLTLGRLANARLQRQVGDALAALPNARFTAAGADWLVGQSGPMLTLRRATDGCLLQRWPAAAPGTPERLAESLADYARAQFLRSLRLDGPSLRASLTLQAARLRPDETLAETLPTPTRRG